MLTLNKLIIIIIIIIIITIAIIIIIIIITLSNCAIVMESQICQLLTK